MVSEIIPLYLIIRKICALGFRQVFSLPVFVNGQGFPGGYFSLTEAVYNNNPAERVSNMTAPRMTSSLPYGTPLAILFLIRLMAVYAQIPAPVYVKHWRTIRLHRFLINNKNGIDRDNSTNRRFPILKKCAPRNRQANASSMVLNII
ncbi:MAG: hypothetical protein ACMUIM_00385 [bacterium]